MNANELADVLMSTKFQVDEDGTMIGVSHQAVNEAVTMLRQQQAEIENLKAGLLSHYDIHPVKELHLSLQKEKETGELLAVTYTDDEHRIVEVLWQRPPVKEEAEQQSYQEADGCPTELVVLKRFWRQHNPVKELTDEEIYRLLADSIWAVGLNTDCLDEQNWADGITVARAILRKAQEK